MDVQLPKRLRTIPILEATAEVRFSDAVPTGAELLVGGFFQHFKGQFNRSERLPLADIPQPIRWNDANLRFAPTYRLQGGNQSLLIGDRSIAVSVVEPYPGWESFRKIVEEVFSKVSTIRGNAAPVRASLKYVNLIESELGTDHLKLLDLAVCVGGTTLTNQPTTLKTEIIDGSFVDVVQVVTQASAVREAGEPAKHGVVVDIDVIYTGKLGELATETALELLDEIHGREKRRFFSILSSDTLNALGPEY